MVYRWSGGVARGVAGGCNRPERQSPRGGKSTTKCDFLPSTNCKLLSQIKGNIRNKCDFLRSQMCLPAGLQMCLPAGLQMCLPAGLQMCLPAELQMRLPAGLQNLATPLATDPIMLHLGTIIRRVLSLALHPFYRRQRRHHHPIKRTMAWPQIRSGELAGENWRWFVWFVFWVYPELRCVQCEHSSADCVSSINCCV
jgi:hypothetical protein